MKTLDLNKMENIEGGDNVDGIYGRLTCPLYLFVYVDGIIGRQTGPLYLFEDGVCGSQTGPLY